MSDNVKNFLGKGWSFPPVFDKLNLGVRMEENEKDIENNEENKIEKNIYNKKNNKNNKNKKNKKIIIKKFENKNDNDKIKDIKL
jgi:hypothetical protein